MTNQDGCKVDVAKIGKNRVALGIHEGADYLDEQARVSTVD